MTKQSADSEIKNEILRLSKHPEKVRITQSAYYDMMGLGLKKFDVCDAICEWINKGKDVHIIITKDAKGHIGKPAYVMKPEINGIKCYVKVSIQNIQKTDESLLIISTHVEH